jgi:hypothetical protein
MKINREFVKEFINTVPLDIYYTNEKIGTVGVHWGYCSSRKLDRRSSQRLSRGIIK